jgi:hypothetical protein
MYGIYIIIKSGTKNIRKIPTRILEMKPKNQKTLRTIKIIEKRIGKSIMRR